jgi:multimeric flavodoxin WrbA
MMAMEQGGTRTNETSPMSRILGITGSPRRGGNTHVLNRHVLEAARQEGANTEEILLLDHEIRECDGCHLCWQGRRCPRNDDMVKLYDQIARSDVLVFGTPVYWYGPTALMKAFIDRFVYFNCPQNRPKIAGKSAAIVLPFENKDPETGEMVVRFFEKCLAYLEMRLAGSLLVPGVTERGEVRHRPEILQRASDLGRQLARIAPLTR